ncbi:MAG TPA: GvpL/GvpF family gas vesicle protein [Thermoleophilaceae bacterium]
MNDELARWAAERAPALRARAEAEAVATLREALVAAVLGERSRVTTGPAPARPPAVRNRDTGDLLWAYCVMRASDAQPTDAPGIANGEPVKRVEAAGLAALVSSVPRAEFGEEPLRQNLNELAWLERIARAHEGVLDNALAGATIVPLRLCTLYENEERVREMLARERGAFSAALDHLAGRQEWGVKVLLDEERLEQEAHARIGGASEIDRDLDSRGSGGAYMLRRRFERELREAAEALASQAAEAIHASLSAFALDAVTRSPQNRDLSGHEGEMILNAAYLVAAERLDEVHELVRRLEDEHRAVGARIEITGPWPPYNFVPGGGTATVA